jgi:hypothetical protein
MAFFRKNTLLLDLMNKFNSMENKIDTLQSKMESVTYLDGCCNCHERETKIYQDLQCFFEHKFEHMKNDILDNIPKENNDNNVNLLEQIVQIIKDTHQKNKEELTTILSDICKKQCENNNLSRGGITLLTETQLRENITGLFTSLVTNHAKFDERLRNKIDELTINIKENDTTLRAGLQDILISIKNDIISSVNSHQNNDKNEQNENLDNFIKHMTEQVNSINDRVDGFYFENETIKHQLLLEEEIRGYNDDIDQIKLLINNVKSTIEDTLHTNGFEHLKAKYHGL